MKINYLYLGLLITILTTHFTLKANCDPKSEKIKDACKVCGHAAGPDGETSVFNYVACMMDSGCTFKQALGSACDSSNLVFSLYNKIPSVKIMGKDPYTDTKAKYKLQGKSICSTFGFDTDSLDVKSDGAHVNLHCGNDSDIEYRIIFQNGDFYRYVLGPYTIDKKYLTGFHPYNAYLEVKCAEEHKLEFELYYVDEETQKWESKLIRSTHLDPGVTCSN
jgi:hypothetical protein